MTSNCFAANLMMVQHEGITVQLHSNNPDGSVNVKIYGALELSDTVVEAWNMFENTHDKIVRKITLMNQDGSVHHVLGQEPALMAED